MCQQFQIEMYKVFLFNIRYTINIGHGIEKPKILNSAGQWIFNGKERLLLLDLFVIFTR